MTDLPAKANLMPREVADFLRCSLSTIYEMIVEDGLPAFKKDKVIRIPREKFIAWYEARIGAAPSDHI